MSSSTEPAPQRAPGHDDHEAHFDASAHVPKTRTVTLGAVLIAIVLGGLVALRGLGHKEPAAQASDAGQPHEAPVVATSAAGTTIVRAQVAKAHPAPAHPMTLPGHVEALEQTAVYARVSGYLRRWLVDIGDPVSEGQTLAEIDTPELDQELSQAHAAVGQAEAQQALANANRALAKSTLARVERLAPAGVMTQQDLDEKRAALAVQDANVLAANASLKAAQANLARLSDIKRFARVTAPFAGTITSRTTERGSLITVGNGANQALFQIAATQIVRVFVDVPQSYAPSIRGGAEGQEAAISVKEFPAETFHGKVTRTARALDAGARTLRTEIQVANPTGKLLPGMYAMVQIKEARSTPLVAIPAPAVVLDSRGTRVAVVRDGHARWQSVEVEEDLGQEVTIASGLAIGDRVVTTPSDALKDGVAVEAVEAAKK